MTDELEGRHPSVRQAMRWFKYDHLTHPEDRQVSASVARLATEMVRRIRDDNELAMGLHKLKEAKDCFVRASMAGRGTPPI